MKIASQPSTHNFNGVYITFKASIIPVVCDISNFALHSKQADCPIGKILALPPSSANSGFQQPREHFNCTEEGKSCELAHTISIFFWNASPHAITRSPGAVPEWFIC